MVSLCASAFCSQAWLPQLTQDLGSTHPQGRFLPCGHHSEQPQGSVSRESTTPFSYWERGEMLRRAQSKEGKAEFV